MKNSRSKLRLPWRTIHGYAMAWTIGLFVAGPFVLYLLLTRKVRIKGYWRFVHALLRGRTFVLMNHPTLCYETWLIVFLPFPWYMLAPRCFMWSMPDRRLLDKWKMPPFVRRLFRCIELDRSSPTESGRGAIDTIEVLERHGNAGGHPEAGRTFGAANRHKVPIEYGLRRMQKIGSRLTLVAHKASAWILPAYVEVPYSEEDASFMESFRRLFGRKNRKYRPITFYFGHPYKTHEPFDLEAENARLQTKIFSA